MKRLLFTFVVACSSKQQEPPPVAVADPKAAAAAHDAKQWKRCAELWLAVAATTKGETAAGPLYEAARCQAQAGGRDAAFATLDRAVAAGLAEPRIADEIDFASLHADARWPKLRAAIDAQRAKAAAAVAEPELRRELLVLAGADTDATARMKEVVAKHGWPGKSLVGKDGAHAAWQLVQRSRDVAFQRECLEKLELAVTQGEARAIDHAHLYDRVAVASGKPQRWGTELDASYAPFPIEDAPRVDERRKAIGLPTLADYQRFLRERSESYEPE